MYKDNELFTLHVDDKVFYLTRRTIELYSDTLLVDVIDDKCTDDRIIKNGNALYIDRDPKSFAYVVDYFRNYEVDLESITDSFLKKKVIDDLDHFDLYCNYDNPKNNVAPMVNININENVIVAENTECDDELDNNDTFVDQLATNKLSKEEMLSQFQQIGNFVLGENNPNTVEIINNLSNNKLFQSLIPQFIMTDSSTDTIEFTDDDDDTDDYDNDNDNNDNDDNDDETTINEQNSPSKMENNMTEKEILEMVLTEFNSVTTENTDIQQLKSELNQLNDLDINNMMKCVLINDMIKNLMQNAMQNATNVNVNNVDNDDNDEDEDTDSTGEYESV